MTVETVETVETEVTVEIGVTVETVETRVTEETGMTGDTAQIINIYSKQDCVITMLYDESTHRIKIDFFVCSLTALHEG